MTSKLDTSGAVIGATTWNSQEGQLARHREIMQGRPHGETIWSDLSPFTQGYIEAMPWRDADGLPMGYSLERDDDGDWVLNGPATVVLFSEPGEGLLIGTCDRATAVTDALAAITDVAGFSDLAPETLARIIADCEHGGGGLRDDADGGHDFWTLRQAGALRNTPPLTVQLGDDGKVRFG